MAVNLKSAIAVAGIAKEVYQYFVDDYNDWQALLKPFRVVVKGKNLGIYEFENELLSIRGIDKNTVEIICQPVSKADKVWNGASIIPNRDDALNVASTPHDFIAEYAGEIAQANGVSLRKIYIWSDRILIAVAKTVAEQRGENKKITAVKLWSIRNLLFLSPRTLWSKVMRAVTVLVVVGGILFVYTGCVSLGDDYAIEIGEFEWER